MTESSGNHLAQDYESLYRSYVALQREVEHLSTLREIGLALNSSLDLNQTLTVIANVVQGALDVRRLTIYDLDEGADRARPIIAKYDRDLITRERLAEEEQQLSGTPLGDAASARAPLFAETNVTHAVYIPLLASSKVVGILVLEDTADRHSVQRANERLYQTLGAQIAVAIHNAQLYAQAVTDGLTGLYVRRYFDLRLAEEFNMAKRYGRTFALMMFDIDHFKRFNDTHGHQTGDKVLVEFAQLLEKQTRRTDICCRYGGEEFAVILPETKLDEGLLLANKLCLRVRQHAFSGMRGEPLSVTTSIGLAEFRPGFETPEKMLEHTDAMLYRAKELGRNRVEVADL